METTTPEAPDTVAPVAQPEPTAQPQAQEPEAADQPTVEPTPETQVQPEPAAADTSDDDLSDYWSKKGIDISTPEGQRKAAQSYREAEQAMHRKSQEASELSKQLTDQPVEVDTDNPLVQELASEVITMKRQQAVTKFASEVNLTRDQETQMAQWLVENPNKAQLINAGLMSLNEAYVLSGAGAPNADSLRKEGEQKALQELADRQRASSVSGAATTSAKSEPSNSIKDLEERLSGVTF